MSEEINNREIKYRIAEPRMYTSPNETKIYVNIAGVSIGPEEVVIQFGLVNADNPLESPSTTRVYMSPGHAKRLAAAMKMAIDQYEVAFGQIKDPSESLTTAGHEIFNKQ